MKSAGMGLFMGVAVATLTLPFAAVAKPGEYAATPQYNSFVRTTELVEVRDGVRLAATVYRPAINGVAVDKPLPVLFNLTPYLSRRIDADGKITGSIEVENRRNRPFAQLTYYGYVVVVADVRGKGSSFGTRWAYADQHEGEDGHDLVQWMGKQGWSDGKVGMFGCSYVGGTQWATARNTPSHLKAIFPQAAQFDSYRNVRRGGISGQYNTRPQKIDEDFPTAPVDIDKDGSLKAAALKQHEANGQMMDLVSSLVNRDDRTDKDILYWALSSPYPKIEDMRKAGISVYLWGNWRDEPVDQAYIAYENMKDGTGLTKMIVGPGDHCDTDTIDSFNEHLRYFDYTLKGIENGIASEPPIYYKTIGLPEDQAWRFADDLPLNDAPATRFYLGPKASLSQTIASKPAFDRYNVTYRVGCQPPAFARGTSMMTFTPSDSDELPEPGMWPCVNSQAAKLYETKAMPEDMWLSGFSIVSLTLKSSAPEAYVFAYLEKVAPDGKAEIIGHGRLLGSQRALGEAPYKNLGLPWHPFSRDTHEAVPVNEPVNLTFELNPTSEVIPKGHKLRLSFTGVDQRQRNWKALRIDPAPVWDIAVGGKDGSYIDMKLVSAKQLTKGTAND
ncbi:MAG: CocE/NonD family hydrolase [Asticcacaulis sp.]